jgi:ABC-type nitrate/sulfonate/bicarbonate transport system ATPase subunit
MLLDEPFGALDSQTRLRMQQFLLEVWSDLGRTILFVTHDVDESIFLSDRVIVLSARPGRVRAEFTVDLPRPRALELLTSDPFTELKRQIFDVIHSETIRALEAGQGDDVPSEDGR